MSKVLVPVKAAVFEGAPPPGPAARAPAWDAAVLTVPMSVETIAVVTMRSAGLSG